MASRELNDQDLPQIHSLAKQWGKIVVRRAFGEQVPDLDEVFDPLVVDLFRPAGAEKPVPANSMRRSRSGAG
jgi:hypothetical protein